MKKIIIYFLFTFGLIVSFGTIVSAQGNPQNPVIVAPTPPQNPVIIAPTPSTPTPGVTARATLDNPLKFRSLSELFTGVAQLAVNVGYVLIAFFLLLSGFKFIKAQGSEKELEEAKKTFYYTIIGAIIIIGAQTIILVVQNIVNSLRA